MSRIENVDETVKTIRDMARRELLTENDRLLLVDVASILESQDKLIHMLDNIFSQIVPEWLRKRKKRRREDKKDAVRRAYQKVRSF